MLPALDVYHTDPAQHLVMAGYYLGYLGHVCPTYEHTLHSTAIRVFAIHQILLGWKTCKYYYETDELTNPGPKPTQEKLGQKWHLGHFFPQQLTFRGLGSVL